MRASPSLPRRLIGSQWHTIAVKKEEEPYRRSRTCVGISRTTSIMVGAARCRAPDDREGGIRGRTVGAARQAAFAMFDVASNWVLADSDLILSWAGDRSRTTAQTSARWRRSDQLLKVRLSELEHAARILGGKGEVTTENNTSKCLR